MNREPQMELAMPDEERALTILKYPSCSCGYNAAVVRKLDESTGRPKYRVECSTTALNQRLVDIYGNPTCMTHEDPTPWLKSSADAVQHWKLVRALSR